MFQEIKILHLTNFHFTLVTTKSVWLQEGINDEGSTKNLVEVVTVLTVVQVFTETQKTIRETYTL